MESVATFMIVMLMGLCVFATYGYIVIKLYDRSHIHMKWTVLLRIFQTNDFSACIRKSFVRTQ